MENTIWKDTKGLPGYEVSNTGLVRNKKTGTILSPFYNNGYAMVTLSHKGAYKRYYVHRLVGINFVDNPDNLPEIDHINRDRSDNRVENIRWVTRRDNILNRAWNRKVVCIDKKTGRSIRFFPFIVTAAEWVIENRDKPTNKLPVQVAITQCCSGQRNSAYGYKWKYSEEYFDYSIK